MRNKVALHTVKPDTPVGEDMQLLQSVKAKYAHIMHPRIKCSNCPTKTGFLVRANSAAKNWTVSMGQKEY